MTRDTAILLDIVSTVFHPQEASLVCLLLYTSAPSPTCSSIAVSSTSPLAALCGWPPASTLGFLPNSPNMQCWAKTPRYFPEFTQLQSENGASFTPFCSNPAYDHGTDGALLCIARGRGGVMVHETFSE
jgi:hypothetical protein